ncbi:hypothetical protein KP509_34G037400 [Ceratopteris richardii]|uniref:Phosphatidylinositol N-acetylglucosaminyltransferase subunit C n=1 Tax=Ceratopteris richardii TaxID=49495 RepID=A0A8T2QLA9_CERRI|nr:hypothetical protein KP509_34G037400 [Ceratopteris richardii]
MGRAKVKEQDGAEATSTENEQNLRIHRLTKLHQQQQHTGDGSPQVKWQKVVYGGMQAGYEDNHTDSSFLEAMVMNANVVKRDTWTTIRDSVAIAQYVCVVAMVSAVWTYSLNGVLDASLLLILDSVLLLLGFFVLLLTTGSISVAILCRYALYFTYFVSGLYVLAPVFQTLTRSISSDSIWALTICLLMVHLCFHDYIDASTRTPPAFAASQGSKSDDLPRKLTVKKPATLSGNVSLNASIVASVLIASRLPSSLLVFALMLFSSEFFLLFPLVTCCMKQYSVKLHLGFSSVLIAVTMGLIFPLNRLALVLFVVVIIFIVLVCPYWLIRIQEYKFEINGPWDEAKLCFDLDQ